MKLPSIKKYINLIKRRKGHFMATTTNIITETERNYLLSSMTNLLRTYDYNPTDEALNKIIDKWATEKANLITAFKRHPNYLPGQFMIAFSTDYERCINPNTLDSFREYIMSLVRSSVRKAALPEEIILQASREGCSYLPDRLYRFLDTLYNVQSRNIDDDIATQINEMLPNIHAHDGEKTSRVMNRIFTYLNYTQDSEYNREFAKYADALSPMTIKRHTVLSLNPLDYLTMSFGNSWSSCHTIDTENKRDMPDGYEGMHASGTMSYMLDPSSMVFYTVDSSYDGIEFWNEPKINRQMFHYGEDKLVQGRLYPQDNDSGAPEYKTYRMLVQEIMATIFDFPNLWNTTRGTDEASAYILSRGTHYHDYNNFDNCTLSRRTEKLNDNSFVVGSNPLCIHCGEEHTIHDNLDCCDAHRGQKKCAHCGEWHDNDDMHEIDGEWFCEYCCIQCRCCGKWVRSELTYVNDYGKVCDECLAGENFIKCADCGEVYFKPYAFKYEDKFICNECFRRYYTKCQVCGKVIRKMLAKTFPGGATACKTCFDILNV